MHKLVELFCDIDDLRAAYSLIVSYATDDLCVTCGCC